MRRSFAADDGDGHLDGKFAGAGTDAAGFDAGDTGFVAAQEAGEKLLMSFAMRLGDDGVVDDLPAQLVERAAQRRLCGGIGIDNSSLKIRGDDAIDGTLLKGIELFAALVENAIAVGEIAGGLVVRLGEVLLFGLGSFVGLIDGVDEIAQMRRDRFGRSEEPVELAQEHAVHRTSLRGRGGRFQRARTRGISPLPSSFIGVKEVML